MQCQPSVKNAYKPYFGANAYQFTGSMSNQQRLEPPITISELESHLWEAANILRGSPVDRTDRTYGERKTHGLIVDYLSVFDDVAKSLEFDEDGFRRVVSDIANLKVQLPEAMQRCLAYFPGVDRSLTGYEGLMAAQDCLPNNDVRDAFAADYSYLSHLWEAISPDPILSQYVADYKWLSQVYISVQPTTGTGALIWHALGAKTIELIHENVHVEAVRDDLDEIVLDADLLEAVLDTPDPDTKAKEIQIRVARRLRSNDDLQLVE